MPALYLNSEVGACATEEQALHCISRTMAAYEALKSHISDLYQEQIAFDKLQLCAERDKGAFISELYPKLDKKTQTKVAIFRRELAKGSIISPPESHTKTLKGLNTPSSFLEYVFIQNGMTLSFASDEYWESDFIEFNEDDGLIPNIWGQTEFVSLNAWLNQCKKQTSTLFSQIQDEFNVKFCDDSVTESSFTLHEWRMIYSAFEKGNHIQFEVTPPLIKKWDTLPIFYIRDKQHSNFTMRIFFIKQGKKVYVGKIYHKNKTNTLKEEYAADSSYKKFCELGLL